MKKKPHVVTYTKNLSPKQAKKWTALKSKKKKPQVTKYGFKKLWDAPKKKKPLTVTIHGITCPVDLDCPHWIIGCDGILAFNASVVSVARPPNHFDKLGLITLCAVMMAWYWDKWITESYAEKSKLYATAQSLWRDAYNKCRV